MHGHSVFLVFEAMIAALEVFTVYLYLSGCLPQNSRPDWQRAAVYLVFGLILGYFSLFRPSMFVLPVLTVLGVLAAALFSCRGTVLSFLILSLLYLFIGMVVEILAAGLASNLYGIELARFHSHGIERTLVTALAKLINLPAVKLVSMAVRRHPGSFARKMRQSVPLIACQIVLIAIAAGSFVDSYQNNGILTDSALAVTAGVFFANIVVFWHYDSMIGYYEAKSRADAARVRFENQAAYYNLAQDCIGILRPLEHDMKLHIAVMRELAGSGAAASEYMSSFTDSVSEAISGNPGLVMSPDPVVGAISGNLGLVMSPDPVVGAVLSNLKRRAKGMGIDDSQIRIDAEVLGPLPFDGPDMTAIFGNTVDNALEALALMDGESGRRISVTLKQRRNFLFYEISNTFDPKKRKARPGGFGLSNAKEHAYRYGGGFSAASDGNVFTVTVSLPLNSRVPFDPQNHTTEQ